MNSKKDKKLEQLKEEIKQALDDRKKLGAAHDSTNKAKATYALTVVADIFAGLIVGGVVGFVIDKFLGTMPLFFIICLVLGMAAGLYNLYRTLEE